MMEPPITAIKSPSTTYVTAIFQPNMLIKSTSEPKSTIGEEIRKLNVTPKGSPAAVKPMKIGIDEQEQNGVIVPKRAATICAVIPLKRVIIFLLRSGGKYD